MADERICKIPGRDKRIPLQSRLHELLDYDPVTGAFIWKERASAAKWWNAKHAGKIAGCHDRSGGYVVISIDDEPFLAHRLAVVYVHGDVLSADAAIDHRNGVRHDNRIANLRTATGQQNNQNSMARPRRVHCDLPKGVYPHKNGRFRSQIRAGGKIVHLGYFASIAEARSAYILAAQEYHGEFARIE